MTNIEAAADTVRSAAENSVHAINDLANETGKKLAGGNLFRGLRRKVNRNPLQSLAVAAAIGLVAGAGISWRATR
jgi:ElaB/YqjD/DUF883 family membrane-anchored ribosome-binding protein